MQIESVDANLIRKDHLIIIFLGVFNGRKQFLFISILQRCRARDSGAQLKDLLGGLEL